MKRITFGKLYKGWYLGISIDTIFKYIDIKLLRPDWDKVKLSIMGELVNYKFDMYPNLKDSLIKTYPHELVEGNWWGDTYWGVCNGVGENNLGLILMSLRELWRSKVHEITLPRAP